MGSVANLVDARPLAGILSCVAARSHRASSRASFGHCRLEEAASTFAKPLRQMCEMLGLQVRLNAMIRAKGRKGCHGLGKPITEITKRGVRLTPPKLQLIRNMRFSV